MSVRWKRWKRAFNLYLTSKGITNEEQKLALLLHSGGMELQEVYYTLVPEDEVTQFKDCVATLDNYFTPKFNVPFERHVFRQMHQLEGETIDQFVCRLRQKCISCEFSNDDEAMRDQIIEKCSDPKLRRKLLEKATNATLNMLLETARVHEAVNVQMKSMGSQDQVNKLTMNHRQEKGKERKDRKFKKERKCYRCDGKGHLGKDRNCPALGKKCNKCGLLGHFSACCKTKTEKKPANGANQISKEPVKEEYYAFALYDSDSSGVVDLCVGGVQLKDVLIDSGATCNIVDRGTWESLKQEGVKCQSSRCDKKLFVYGQTKPTEVVGTFKSEVYCNESGERCVGEFTVVESH